MRAATGRDSSCPRLDPSSPGLTIDVTGRRETGRRPHRSVPMLKCVILIIKNKNDIHVFKKNSIFKKSHLEDFELVFQDLQRTLLGHLQLTSERSLPEPSLQLVTVSLELPA